MLDVMGISLQPDLTPYLNLLSKLDYFSKLQLKRAFKSAKGITRNQSASKILTNWRIYHGGLQLGLQVTLDSYYDI